MSKKRIEFLNSLNTKETNDGGNIFMNARLNSERIEREKNKASDIGNLFLARKLEGDYERRRKEEGRAL